jgi:hypothetical protein
LWCYLLNWRQFNLKKQIFPFGIENFLYNEGKKKIYTATKAEEMIAQSKKLDGEPIYTASSWIEK